MRVKSVDYEAQQKKLVKSPQKHTGSKKVKKTKKKQTPERKTVQSKRKGAKIQKTKAKPYEKKIKLFKTQADYFALNEKYKSMGMSTRVIHCGSEPGQEFGGVSVPLDFSSTFAQPKPGSPIVFDYARCGNPTRLALER